MTTRIVRLAAAVAVAVGAGLVVSAAPAQAHRPTCLGEPATLVGRAHDTTIVGTPGRDVIVSHGDVVAGGGDDLICVLGRGDVSVDAGPGADRVHVDTARGADVRVDLGPGRDVLRGGAGREILVASGSDDIATGGGSDTVGLDTTEGTPFTGRLDLGPGADEVQAAPYSPAVGAVLRGGAGTDRLLLYDLGADLDVDNRAGRVTTAGVRVLDGIESFESFDAWPFSSEETYDLRFRGSRADERLDARAWDHLDVAMGGGVDQVVASRLDDGATLTGGGQAGDALDLSQAVGPLADPVTIDLATGRSSVDGLLPARMTIAGFTRLRFEATIVRFTGSAAPERVTIRACTTNADGGAGADRLDFDRLPASSCGSRAYDGPRLTGGAGDDVLVGSRSTDDTLVGGPGRDRADGRDGVDTCVAERRVSCEA